MDTTNFTDDDILYCLENLAGYEPEDIEHDDVEIAIGDDHFGQMSIVRTAELGAMLIKNQAVRIKELQDALESLIQGYDSEEVAHIFGLDHTTAENVVFVLSKEDL